MIQKVLGGDRSPIRSVWFLLLANDLKSDRLPSAVAVANSDRPHQTYTPPCGHPTIATEKILMVMGRRRRQNRMLLPTDKFVGTAAVHQHESMETALPSQLFSPRRTKLPGEGQ